MVAERIVVTSRRAGSDRPGPVVFRRRSGFEIAPAANDDAKRVTRAPKSRCHLKRTSPEISQTYQIEAFVRYYSDNSSFPIELVPEEGEPPARSIRRARVAAAEVGALGGGLQAGYQSVAGAFERPAMTLHYRAEGRQSYAVLLFSASTKPSHSTRRARQG